jgi:hypothetical protein
VVVLALGGFAAYDAGVAGREVFALDMTPEQRFRVRLVTRAGTPTLELTVERFPVVAGTACRVAISDRSPPPPLPTVAPTHVPTAGVHDY